MAKLLFAFKTSIVYLAISWLPFFALAKTTCAGLFTGSANHKSYQNDLQYQGPLYPLLYKRSFFTGERSEHFLSEETRYHSVSKLNRIFGFNHKSELRFVTKGFIFRGNVETEVYLRYLSEGKVIVNGSHDYENHVIGYVRIASTETWKSAKKELQRLFTIMDNAKTKSYTKELVLRAIHNIGDVLEVLTSDISEYDNSNSSRARTLLEFESQMQKVLTDSRQIQ